MHFMESTALWVGLVSVAGAATEPAAPATTRSTMRPDAVQSWAGKRVTLTWQDEPLANALLDLATQLEYPLWTSDEARRLAASKRLSYTGRNLPAVSALGVVCRLGGLDWVADEGAIIITAGTDATTIWRLKRDGLVRRLRRDHPDWLGLARDDRRADLDLVDASIRAAIQRLREAYGVTLVADEDLLKSQKLVTLQGTNRSLEDTLAALGESLNAQAEVEGGVVWLTTGSQRAASPRPQESSPSPAEPGGLAGTHRGVGRWVRLAESGVRAEGWGADVDAVIRVQRHERTGATTSGSSDADAR